MIKIYHDVPDIKISHGMVMPHPKRKWVPVEPEPCCENCQNLIEVHHEGSKVSITYVVCEEVTKAVQSGNDPVSNAYEITDLAFYCKFWRRKE